MPAAFAQIYVTARGTYCPIERSYSHSRRCDNLEVSRVLMEELLESFVTAALGLTLASRISDVSQLPELQLARNHDTNEGAWVCSAWHTDRGRVIACVTYHHEQSQKMKAHVLWLEWWIAPHEHHEGWWRCEAKWPRDWVKGPGTPYP
jgi:hypothetical protein